MQTRNSFALTEGQSVTFVLRTPLDEAQAVILEQCDKQERTQQCRIVGHRDGDKGILWSPRWSRYRLVIVGTLSFVPFSIFMACTNYNSALV